jgi:hypothetical protein
MGFLGNVNAVNFRKLVEDPITSYENFLFSHLYFLRADCGAIGDESGQHFHQDISATENRYKGKWSAAM